MEDLKINYTFRRVRILTYINSCRSESGLAELDRADHERKRALSLAIAVVRPRCQQERFSCWNNFLS